ncbi:DUF6338 family protein [Citricoccus sp. GCM10030269]|uniref:DUF6338 family protein n=1 Tax=Citricoccus sp. GCM10030269 TaxID=3273388 RepID=UPI003608A337
MIPTSWTAFLLFIMFVTPGLAFDYFSQRRRPNADESIFRESSRVVQASVWFAFPGVTLAILLWWVLDRQKVPQPSEIVDGGVFVELGWGFPLGLVAYLAGSVGTAYLTDLWLRRKHGATLTSTHSQWVQAFKRDRPEATQTYVRLKTDSGDEWSGLVKHYSADFEVAGREIILAPPISHRSPANSDPEPVEHLAELVVRGDAIESIQVIYVPLPPQTLVTET